RCADRGPEPPQPHRPPAQDRSGHRTLSRRARATPPDGPRLVRDWPAPPDTAPPLASSPRRTSPRTPTAPATTSNAIVYDACYCFFSPPPRPLPDHMPAGIAIPLNSAPSRFRTTPRL